MIFIAEKCLFCSNCWNHKSNTMADIVTIEYSQFENNHLASTNFKEMCSLNFHHDKPIQLNIKKKKKKNPLILSPIILAIYFILIGFYSIYKNTNSVIMASPSLQTNPKTRVRTIYTLHVSFSHDFPP